MNKLFYLAFACILFSTNASTQNCPTNFLDKNGKCVSVSWALLSAPLDPLLTIEDLGNNTVYSANNYAPMSSQDGNLYTQYFNNNKSNCGGTGYSAGKDGTFEFSFNSGNTATCSYNSSGAILPIELTHFTVSFKNNRSTLSWKTSSELNNSRFIIERQRLGSSNNFEEIGEIKGSGTSNKINSYEFIDQFPHLGLNYYRLKQVDFDGSSSYSAIEVVNHNSSKDEISYRVINNTIILSSAVAGKVFISDITGKVLHQKNIIANEYLQILLEGQIPGLYFISLQDRNSLTTSKFILH